jgi:hypothetical protein
MEADMVRQMVLVGAVAVAAVTSGCIDAEDFGGGGSACAEDEIEDPGTGQCWKRCRGDQRWLGDSCSTGLSGRMSAVYAAAECDGPSHLPSVTEMTAFLDNCKLVDGRYECNSCTGSSGCGEVYGSRPDVFLANVWTSTPCTMKAPLVGAGHYVAYLDDGVVQCFWKDMSFAAPLCVRNP